MWRQLKWELGICRRFARGRFDLPRLMLSGVDGKCRGHCNSSTDVLARRGKSRKEPGTNGMFVTADLYSNTLRTLRITPHFELDVAIDARPFEPQLHVGSEGRRVEAGVGLDSQGFKNRALVRNSSRLRHAGS